MKDEKHSVREQRRKTLNSRVKSRDSRDAMASRDSRDSRDAGDDISSLAMGPDVADSNLDLVSKLLGNSALQGALDFL